METKEIILTHEKVFAAHLANAILEKPKLNAWMIFIPFIFVFYFQDLSKYKSQRKEFLENWLLSREKTLDEVAKARAENRAPGIDSLVDQADLGTKPKEKYRVLLKVMEKHYDRLLQAQGDSYETLARAAYTSKGDYRFHINQLLDAEKALNKSLTPQLKKDNPDVTDTITRIEKNSEKLRRLEIDRIFNG